VEGDAKVNGKAERVGAIFNAEHNTFVAHDGSQTAGLASFLGDLLEVVGGDGHDAFAWGNGSHRKIKNALGELVAFVFLVTAEVAELTEGAADAEDRVLWEAGELDQFGESTAFGGLAKVFHDEEGTLQVRDGVIGFGWHFVVDLAAD
jgi:hypothetical protein